MSTSGRLYAQASFGSQVTGQKRNWINGSVTQATVNPWTTWLSTYADPAVLWGVDGFLIHNPFGTRTSDNLYSFDQYGRAKDEVPNLLTDFHSAWKSWMGNNPDQDIVSYIGTSFENTRKQNRGSFRYYLEQVLPFFRLGMGLGIDACIEEKRDDFLYQIALMYSRHGLQIYAEGRPKTTYPHWANFGCISTVSNWQQAETGGFNAVASEDINGPLMIIADTDFSSSSAQITKIQEALALHPTAKVTIPVWWLIDNGVTLSQVEV